MKNELSTFTYEFDSAYFGSPMTSDIRVVELDGKPWFVARDIAILLGYRDTNQATRMHCRKAISAKGRQINGVHPNAKLIPESDLYRLIIRSDMEEAERFQDWVCEDVLPTIRKTGGTYMSDDALAKTLEDPDYMIGILKHMKELKAERDLALRREEHAIKTKAEIGSRREASAMGTANAAKIKQRKAEAELKELKDTQAKFVSAAVVLSQIENDFFTGKGGLTAGTLGKYLKKLSLELGNPMDAVQMPQYQVLLFHTDTIEVFKARIRMEYLPDMLRVHKRDELITYLKRKTA